MTTPITFQEHNQISFYNAGTYESFEDALESGAVYTTPSTHDALSIGNSKNPAYDLEEALHTQNQCLGSDDIVYGVVSNEKTFVQLKDFIETYLGY